MSFQSVLNTVGSSSTVGLDEFGPSSDEDESGDPKPGNSNNPPNYGFNQANNTNTNSAAAAASDSSSDSDSDDSEDSADSDSSGPLSGTTTTTTGSRYGLLPEKSVPKNTKSEFKLLKKTFKEARDRWKVDGFKCYYLSTVDRQLYVWDQPSGILFLYCPNQSLHLTEAPAAGEHSYSNTGCLPLWTAQNPGAGAEIWTRLPLPPTDPASGSAVSGGAAVHGGVQNRGSVHGAHGTVHGAHGAHTAHGVVRGAGTSSRTSGAAASSTVVSAEDLRRKSERDQLDAEINAANRANAEQYSTNNPANQSGLQNPTNQLATHNPTNQLATPSIIDASTHVAMNATIRDMQKKKDIEFQRAPTNIVIDEDSTPGTFAITVLPYSGILRSYMRILHRYKILCFFAEANTRTVARCITPTIHHKFTFKI